MDNTAWDLTKYLRRLRKAKSAYFGTVIRYFYNSKWIYLHTYFTIFKLPILN